jgi:hypothetical protein
MAVTLKRLLLIQMFERKDLTDMTATKVHGRTTFPLSQQHES